MAKSYNTEPYYDDFDEKKNYHRILFRPGYAVQARELTQLQTALQNQVTKFGNHVFKEGTMVVPGESSIDTKIGYVKLESSYAGTMTDTVIDKLVGSTVRNTSNNLEADVIWYAKSTGSEPSTLFVRYKKSADDNTTKTFSAGDIITDSTNTLQVAAVAPTGIGSIATINPGIYYIKGYFVYVESQTIVLDKFGDTPSYRIGLSVTETEITGQEDESLFDNAQNSFNYAAPGAHRYNIATSFVALPADSTDDADFIELIRVQDGEIVRAVNQTEYSILAKEFARRTADESGDYTVKNFEIDVREYRNNDRGQWVGNRVYLIGDVVSNGGNLYVAKNNGTSSSSVPPTHTAGTAYDGGSNSGIQWEYTTTPYYNRGVYKPAATSTLIQNQAMEAQLAIGMEPGKAYVQGWEIIKPSTTYVPVDKARTFNQVSGETLSAIVGNYVKVKNVFGIPPLASTNRFATVTLYDRAISTNGSVPSGGVVVGTARARYIELDSGIASSGAYTSESIYKLGLFDIKMNSNYTFDRNVKSFYADNGLASKFTADISPVVTPETRLSGSVTASGTAVTGNGTSFQTDFIVGDYIRVQNTSGNFEVRRITAIGGQGGLTIESPGFSGTVTNSVYDIVKTSVVDPQYSGLVFPFKRSGIKSVTDSTGTVDTSYSVYEVSPTVTVSAGTVTITTTNAAFANGGTSDQYTIFNVTDGGTLQWTSVNAAAGTSATLSGINTSFNGKSVVVLSQVNKSGATLTQKTKNLTSGATVNFTTQATAQAKTLSLGKADGYRLTSVKMKSGTFASPGSTYSIDITDRYDFDDGQRDSYYDVAKIILKSSFAPPEAPIQVTFDYFTHTNGDYFTIDSYTNIDRKYLPYWNGTSLGDVIDFRPRIDDAGSTFTGTGAVGSGVLKRGEDPVVDYKYYLPRKTKIALDLSGTFFAIDGVPDIIPGEPLDPSLGMVLYGLTLDAYTTFTDNVTVKRYDNKRYTMRDIGKLEKRIDNLEHYTSLSLLEQQTESLTVTDANGLDRFKNGFIVDNFHGHQTGGVGSLDYMCAIDMENAELRPFFSMHNVNLIEKAVNDTARSAAQYKNYGDVITLPVIDHIPLIKQDYASRLENINPFAVFTFLGDIKLNPSSDDWFEVDRRPDLVIDVEGNFSTMKNMAEKAGILGTVWNSWQNQWYGTATTTITYGGKYADLAKKWGADGRDLSSNTGVGFDKTKHGWAYVGGSYTVTTTTAQQVGQSRTGVKTSLIAKIDRQVIGDKVLSSAVIPFIRSRNILVQIQKLKPNSKFYPFFDGVDISSFCTPASTIVYNPVSGTFNAEVNVGGNATNSARMIAGDSQVCLNKGDVITGATSGATAVVVGKEFNPDIGASGQYSLKVVNIKGTFSANETITGSNSSAQGTVVSSTKKSAGDNLITNFAGEIQLLFNIPNNDAIKFRCGSREFKLVDVPDSDGAFTSRARAQYRAEGILEQRQTTIHSVRNAELVEEQVAESQVIVVSSEKVAKGTVYYDPLAQTFLIDQKGGCFLTKVDVFFASKDDKIPVTIELRETVNGYPGQRVLPFSKVTLNPSDVKLSSATVPLSTGEVVNKWDTPTTFTFPSPVYVQEGTEYAVILSSDSNAYNVWVSQVGETMPGTSRTISEQPYLGTLFKSQNASTWTADQTQDLKFTIYRAQFDTNAVANVEYVNDVLPFQTLDTDPFETRLGVNKVRVWQKDHNMPPMSNGLTKVVLTTTGTAGTGTVTSSTSSTTLTGSGTSFNSQLAAGYCVYYVTDTTKIGDAGTFVGKVSSVTNNTTVVLSANASIAVSGKSFVFVPPLNGIPANEIFGTQVVSSTGLEVDNYTFSTTTSATSSGYVGGNTVRASRNLQFDAIQPAITCQTFSDTTTDFQLTAISGKSVHSTTQTAYTANSATGVLANETNYFTSPRMVASQVNEDNNISGAKSRSLSVKMQTVNDALSPILDTHRTSAVLINNKINVPTEANNNIASLDYNPLTGGTAASPTQVNGITISGNTITTNTQQAMFLLASVGKYITVTPATGTATTALVTAVAADGTSITFGSTLASGSGNVSLVQRERFVAENAPIASGSMSKYVTKRIDLADASNTYIRVNFAGNIPAEANVEVWYRVNPAGYSGDFNLLSYKQIVNPDSPIVNAQNESNQFFDVAFSATEVPFDAIQVKLVMKSTNSSQVPRLKDLRVICCS